MAVGPETKWPSTSNGELNFLLLSLCAAPVWSSHPVALARLSSRHNDAKHGPEIRNYLLNGMETLEETKNYKSIKGGNGMS